MRILFFLGLCATLIIPWSFAQASGSWPASSSGVEIGSVSLASALPSFEVSGLVWHEGLQKLIAVDDGGYVASMDRDGSHVSYWYVGGDLEAVTLADQSSAFVYLGIENPDGIKEFNLSTGTLTGRQWDLTPWMTGADNSGLEGLTFIPDGEHPYGATTSGGVFYASLQATGQLFVFDVNRSVNGSVTHVTTLSAPAGRTDASDLAYLSQTQTVYLIHDGYDVMEEFDPQRNVSEAEYTLPVFDQEGLTFIPDCASETATIYLGDDGGPRIYRYTGYPISCVVADASAERDADGDGYTTTADCDDTQASVHPGALEVCDRVDNDCDGTIDSSAIDATMWYRDADGDEHGTSSVASVIACAAPAGYVSNTGDCDDTNAAIFTEQTYYLDADGDGLGSDTVGLFCAPSAPAGYVTNSDDVDDTAVASRLEIKGDAIDNDGDGRRDEFNTLEENGADVTYATRDPSARVFGTDLLSIRERRFDGALFVLYGDHAEYFYSIFPSGCGRASVRSIARTAYLAYTCDAIIALINGYDGTIVTTTSTTRSR